MIFLLLFLILITGIIIQEQPIYSASKILKDGSYCFQCSTIKRVKITGKKLLVSADFIIPNATYTKYKHYKGTYIFKVNKKTKYNLDNYYGEGVVVNKNTYIKKALNKKKYNWLYFTVKKGILTNADASDIEPQL